MLERLSNPQAHNHARPAPRDPIPATAAPVTSRIGRRMSSRLPPSTPPPATVRLRVVRDIHAEPDISVVHPKPYTLNPKP
jgi:hypothetical protein